MHSHQILSVLKADGLSYSVVTIWSSASPISWSRVRFVCFRTFAILVSHWASSPTSLLFNFYFDTNLFRLSFCCRTMCPKNSRICWQHMVDSLLWAPSFLQLESFFSYLFHLRISLASSCKRSVPLAWL